MKKMIPYLFLILAIVFLFIAGRALVTERVLLVADGLLGVLFFIIFSLTIKK